MIRPSVGRLFIVKLLVVGPAASRSFPPSALPTLKR